MKHPLALAAVAAGGLYLWSARARANASVAPKADPRQVAYKTPTGVAEQLGQFVVGMLRGITPSDPKGVFSTPASLPDQFASETARLVRQAGDPLADAAARYSTPDWTLPSLSLASDASVARFGDYTDSVIAGPVYNPGTDFWQNPLGSFGPNPFGAVGP